MSEHDEIVVRFRADPQGRRRGRIVHEHELFQHYRKEMHQGSRSWTPETELRQLARQEANEHFRRASARRREQR